MVRKHINAIKAHALREIMSRRGLSYVDALKFMADAYSHALEKSLASKVERFLKHLNTLSPAKRIEMEDRLRANLEGELQFAAKHGKLTMDEILTNSRLEHQIKHLASVIESDKKLLPSK